MDDESDRPLLEQKEEFEGQEGEELEVIGIMLDDGRWLTRSIKTIIILIGVLTLSAIVILCYKSIKFDSTSSTASTGRQVAVDRYRVGSIIGQPPTARYYTFNISQSYHSPDGVNKSMFLINSLYPGPTIEANTHDRIIITVHNLLNEST